MPRKKTDFKPLLEKLNDKELDDLIKEAVLKRFSETNSNYFKLFANDIDIEISIIDIVPFVKSKPLNELPIWEPSLPTEKIPLNSGPIDLKGPFFWDGKINPLGLNESVPFFPEEEDLKEGVNYYQLYKRQNEYMNTNLDYLNKNEQIGGLKNLIYLRRMAVKYVLKYEIGDTRLCSKCGLFINNEPNCVCYDD